jgi:pimeloyl-ACP methyl ester carboxylesterase
MEMAFANDLAAEHGVRVVSFDRPGYDGSSTAPFGLVSIARDAAAESQPPSGTCCPNTTGC